MSYSAGVLSVATYDPSPFRRKASPQAVIGNVALAFVVLACAWTLYSNIAPNGVYTVAATPYASDVPDTSLTPRDRIAAASLALEPQTFSNTTAKGDRLPLWKPALAKGDRLPIAHPQQFAALTSPPVAAEPLTTQSLPPPAPVQDVAQTASNIPLPEARPLVQEAALSIPLPTPRPAALRATQDDGPSRADAARANKAAVLAAISAPKPSIFERLFGLKQEKGPTLAFASPDGGIASDGQSLAPGRAAPLYDKQTAVYDISARTVYMPDGTRLEAHSGLGSRLDDPRYVSERMRGPTPPHVYDLSLRESLFHGVQALRLTPIGGEEKIFGRTGLLAHTYMLGPNGDSNGCVSFRNYDAFLRAYRGNEIKRLVVVAKLD